MDDIFVGRLMSSPVRTVDPETPVDEAARMMVDDGIGSVAVVDDLDHLKGILTSTDFVQAIASGESVTDTPSSAFMTEDVITTTANTPIRDVADLMTEHGFHHVPVVEDEHVIGMITTTDLTVYLSHLETPSPT